MIDMSLPTWQSLTPAERLVIIRPLWVAGQTAGDIASQFVGATRNSILGALSRAHMLKTGRAPHNPSYRPPSKPAVKKQTVMRQSIRKLSQPHVEPVLDPLPHVEETIPTTLIPLIELGAHTCRWPFGDPLKPGFGFCGAYSEAEKPYCETHMRRAKGHMAAPIVWKNPLAKAR